MPRLTLLVALLLALLSSAFAHVASSVNTTKVYYHQTGNQFRITPKVSLNLHEKLPPGTYAVAHDGSEFYLDTIDDFQLKGKLYGDVAKTSSRIMNTFLDRTRSTGVLLVGEKGSGKTLLAQYTSIVAAKELSIPTIVVNKPWHGDQFNAFIQSINQPAIILMDEFEKVYDESHQQQMILTLFDGVYSSQKLFLLTCNDKYRIDMHMMNRPGRLYYLMEFSGLDESFVQDYCEDNLLQKEYIPAFRSIAALFRSFNFDMLKALVEDMNRYGESPNEVMKFLNVSPESSSGDYEGFRVNLIVGGERVKDAQNIWHGSPVSEVIRIRAGYEEDEEGEVHYFSAKNLQKLDPKTRVFEFMNEAGDTLTLTPARVSRFTLDYETLASSISVNAPLVTTDSISEAEKEYHAVLN